MVFLRFTVLITVGTSRNRKSEYATKQAVFQEVSLVLTGHTLHEFYFPAYQLLSYVVYIGD